MTKKTKKAPLGYRATLRPAISEDLERANEGRAEDDRYRPFQEDLGRIPSTNADKLPAAYVLRLLTHPDERTINIALERGVHWTFRRPAHEKAQIESALDALKARLIEDAKAEGVAWTPLMHRLATSGSWRRSGVKPAQAATQKRKLAPWVRAQTDTNAIIELLDAFAGDRVIAEVVAANANVLDRAIVTRLVLENRYYAASGALAKNPACDAPTVQWLISEGIRRLVDGADPGQLIYFARQAIRNGYSLGSNDRTRLETAVLSNARSAILCASLLLLEPNLDGERIGRMWQALSTSPLLARHSIEPFVEHPNTPIEILRQIAHEHTAGGLRVRLARNPSAIADPEIRELLADRVHGKRVLAELVKTAEPDEVDRLFSLLLKRNPAGAAQFVEENGLPENVEVRREQLLRLLDHKDRDVRSVAIRLVGSLKR